MGAPHRDRMKEPDRAWVCLAVIRGAHGVKGDVRLRIFADKPEMLEQYNPLFLGADKKQVHLRLLAPLKDGWQARIDGVANREEAQAFSGLELFTSRTALDEVNAADDGQDEFFLVDLVGLSVRSPEGKVLGVVHDVPNFGSGDLLELRLDDPVPGLGKTVLLPFERTFVPDVAVRGGYVTVDLGAWHAVQSDSQLEPKKG